MLTAIPTACSEVKVSYVINKFLTKGESPQLAAGIFNYIQGIFQYQLNTQK